MFSKAYLKLLQKMALWPGQRVGFQVGGTVVELTCTHHKIYFIQYPHLLEEDPQEPVYSAAPSLAVTHATSTVGDLQPSLQCGICAHQH